MKPTRSRLETAFWVYPAHSLALARPHTTPSIQAPAQSPLYEPYGGLYGEQRRGHTPLLLLEYHWVCLCACPSVGHKKPYIIMAQEKCHAKVSLSLSHTHTHINNARARTHTHLDLTRHRTIRVRQDHQDTDSDSHHQPLSMILLTRVSATRTLTPAAMMIASCREKDLKNEVLEADEASETAQAIRRYESEAQWPVAQWPVQCTQTLSSQCIHSEA